MEISNLVYDHILIESCKRNRDNGNEEDNHQVKDKNGDDHTDSNNSNNNSSRKRSKDTRYNLNEK